MTATMLPRQSAVGLGITGLVIGRLHSERDAAADVRTEYQRTGSVASRLPLVVSRWTTLDFLR